MDPKQMAQAMKAMGIKQREVPADEVIIRSGDNEIVIKDPQVVEVTMQGVRTYQIMGNIIERSKIRDEDVKMVSDQTGATSELARTALEKANGNIAQAIMELGE